MLASVEKESSGGSIGLLDENKPPEFGVAILQEMTSRKEDGSHLIVPLEKEMNSTRLSNSTDEELERRPAHAFPRPSEKYSRN